MQKKLFTFLVFILFTFFVPKGTVYSQEPPQEVVKPTFDQVYAEYIDHSEEYNKAHSEYVLKKSQFLKFQSLKSRQDAFDATLVMLEKRDDVVISYLKVLRVKIEEVIGISDARKEGLFFRIDEEISWYTNHRDNLSTTGSLDDMVVDSKLAADRWVNIDPLAYEVMSVLAQGKIADFSKRLDDIFAATKSKMEIIRNDEREGFKFGSSKFQILDRWVFEADGKITRSKEKQSEADILINEIIKSKKLLTSNYETIITKLRESQLYMKEADLFIKEIVRQIKTQE